jgi:16S rRNA (guanine966-N2)-methyltransferase
LRQHQDHKPFDLIFLDPPFGADLLPKCFGLLSESTLVNENTLIYIESPKELTKDDLPYAWQLLKQKTAGEVAYHLVQGGVL